MVTQEELNRIQADEEFFFDLFKVPLPAPKKGGAAPLRPDNVDAILKRALNQLRAKQILVKKRSAGLNANKPGSTSSELVKASDPGEKNSETQKKKKKKIDKKDKKERRKQDLKGRSSKKDAKNKAVKDGGGDEDEDSAMEVTSPEVTAPNMEDEAFLFGKIATADSEAKKQMGKDFKRHLKTLKEKKEKIAKAKNENPALGDDLEEDEAWKNTLQKAQGVKVKDDENLLKKSIRRKEKLKEQRKKKWVQRDKEVEEKMETKRNKRAANIRAKKDEKIKKKVKRMTKKGRLVPGLNAPDL